MLDICEQPSTSLLSTSTFLRRTAVEYIDRVVERKGGRKKEENDWLTGLTD